MHRYSGHETFSISCVGMSQDVFYERPISNLDLHDGEYFDQQARKAAREANRSAVLWILGMTMLGIGFWGLVYGW
jgi:hypothetical protein